MFGVFSVNMAAYCPCMRSGVIDPTDEPTPVSLRDGRHGLPSPLSSPLPPKHGGTSRNEPVIVASVHALGASEPAS